jgi:hypothetical protein
VWLRDIFSTTLSSITPLSSPFIMRRRMSGTSYCPVPSDVWVTVETLVPRSMRLGLSGPTGQRAYISGIVLDSDPSVPASMVWAWLGNVSSCRRGSMVLGRLFFFVKVFAREPIDVLLGCSTGGLIGSPPCWVAQRYLFGGRAVIGRSFGPSRRAAYQMGWPISGSFFGGLWAFFGYPVLRYPTLLHEVTIIRKK